MPRRSSALQGHHCKWFCLLLGLGLPKQAMGRLPPLGLGLIVEDKPTEFHARHKP